MDLLVREESGLAWALLDAWLAESGDYAAGQLLDWYVVYRSMVRAKVAGLQAGQAQGRERAEHRQRLRRHLDLAVRISQRRAPRLLLMCGLSGSGKSWWAERLVPALGAVRLRSDVERKRLHGLDAAARSGSAVDGGIYTPAATARTYDRLADCTGHLLAGGVDTIVDATFLDAAQRERFVALGAAAGARTAVLLCTAPDAVLHERVVARAARGTDASEAGPTVLDRQRSTADLPTQGSLACPLVSVGPEDSLDALLERLDAQL